MAEVTLTIGGRNYRVACRDGGEAHLQEVGGVLDEKIGEAARALGELGENRQLLLGALLLADELLEARRSRAAPAGPALPSSIITALENLADRVETLAQDLERSGGSA